MDKTDISIETYNHIVDEYEAFSKTVNSIDRVQWQAEMDYIIPLIPNDAKILDAATKLGAYPKYLANLPGKHYDIIGLEPAEKLLERAIKNVPGAKFMKMDLRNIELPENSFDLILCLSALIHLNDDDCIKTLNSFDRLVKAGGFIVINVPEHRDDVKEKFFDEPFNPKYKTYFNSYKKEFFADYFKARGGYLPPVIFDNFLSEQVTVDTMGTEIITNEFTIIAQKA